MSKQKSTTRWEHAGGGTWVGTGDLEMDQYPCGDDYDEIDVETGDPTLRHLHLRCTVEAHRSIPQFVFDLKELHQISGVMEFDDSWIETY